MKSLLPWIGRKRPVTMALVMGAFCGFLLPHVASAVAPIWVVCTGLAGCGKPPGNAIVSAVYTGFTVLVGVSAGTAVLFVVWNGLQMVLAFGDEGKFTNARWGVLYALLGLGIALFSGTAVSFVSTQYFGQCTGFFSGCVTATPSVNVLTVFMRTLTSIIALIFNVLFGIAVVIAGMRILVGGGKSDELGKAGSIIKACITGAVIVNVGRALVQAFLSLNL